MNIVILLTSSINPGDYDFVGRKGVEIRHKEYLDSVKFYSQFKFPIIFIDNSNYHSDEINRILGNIINSQYLCFQSSESAKGKGHGELEIIKYGLRESSVLRNSDYVLKISGRYIISNFGDFYLGLNLNSSYHYCNFSRNLSWADTRILIIDQSFLKKYLIPTMDRFLDESRSVFFERVYAMSLHLYQYEGGRIMLWPIYPYYNAINGQNGKSIDFNFIKKLKYFLFYKVKKNIFNQKI